MQAGSPPRTADRRERARLVRRRRRVAAGLMVALVAGVLLVTLSAGDRSARPTTPSVHAAVAAPARAAVEVQAVPASAAHSRTHTVNPGEAAGRLPQTHAFPSSDTARFRTRMRALWAGVRSDSVTRALPAFFPRSAYVQLKQEGAPAADWRYRLVHDYAMDIAAAHRLLGSGASSARLLEVKVPESYGHWVPPGVCYNGIGYYELPNARVVYSRAGRTASFGIASMISWRGEWYVVHLGTVLREGETGVVDEPSSGVGNSASSGTC